MKRAKRIRKTTIHTGGSARRIRAAIVRRNSCGRLVVRPLFEEAG